MPSSNDSYDLSRIQGPLRQLLDEQIRNDTTNWNKVYQYAQLRRNDLYYRGLQYLTIGEVEGFLDYKPVAGGMEVRSSEQGQMRNYVVNQFRGDLNKLIAVLGSRFPNVKGMPEIPGDESQVRLSRIADRAAAFLRGSWDVGEAQRYLAMSLGKNGTTFSYVPFVADRDRYGETQEPRYEMRERRLGDPYYKCPYCGEESPAQDSASPGVCPQCERELGPESRVEPPSVFAPEATGSVCHTNGSVELNICSAYMVTTPFRIRRLGDTPWLWYEYEEHKGRLIRTYPQLREARHKEMSGSSGYGSAQGQTARDAAVSLSGSPSYQGRDAWSYARYWLMPSMYELMPNDQSGELREHLFDICPDGAKLTVVNKEIIAIDPERLTEVWAACKSGTSEYLYADPIFNDYVQAQDIINDFFTIFVEAAERSIPITVADPEVIDPERLRNRANTPGEFVWSKPGLGSSLPDSFFRVPAAEVRPDLMQFIDVVISRAREITGVLPAIFGGGSGDNTAREAELRRNQALQQLNTIWNGMRSFWERTHENGVGQLAKYTVDGRVHKSRGAASSASSCVIDGLEELLSGGWRFDAEEVMPMTAGQRRDFYMDLMSKSPDSIQLLGLSHPQNLSKIQEVVGMPDHYIPGLDGLNRVMDTIAQLMMQPPAQQPTPEGGMMDVPSIPVDLFLFDPPMVVGVIKDWALSEKGRAAQESNPDGFRNVIAYGVAYQSAMQPPPMPPGSPQGPPGQGPEGPPMEPPPGLPAGPPQGSAGPPQGPSDMSFELPPGMENVPPGQEFPPAEPPRVQ